MAHGGAAMGRDDSGRVIFVQGGMPGETVVARVVDAHERFAHAMLAAVPDPPSPDRVASPPCPYFGTWPGRGQTPDEACGGCQWQHVSYDAQLRFKREVLIDALTRIGGLEAPMVHAPVGMDHPWRYRNRVTVRSDGSELGFTALDGLAFVPIEVCAIAHPYVQELLAALDPHLPPGADAIVRAGVHTGDRMVVFAGLGDDVEEIDVEVDASVAILDDEGSLHLASGRPRIAERLGGKLFDIPAASFFQVNTEMAERMVAVVADALPPELDTLVDAYSGVGVFAILLAGRAREVIAVEADPLAVAAAADNAAGLDHLTLLEATAAEGLAYLDHAPDAVIVDPPRTGVDRESVRLLADLAPPTIIYVSCEPSTLARDARQLAAAGYTLRWSRPVDLFPQTYHVESVNLFAR